MKLSNNKNSNDSQKKTKATAQQTLVRFMCLFLAILMIAGCASIIFAFWGSKFEAEAAGLAFPNNLIAVGLECGAREVAVGFELSTTNGFVVNTATIARDERAVRRIYSLPETRVCITNDANLSKNGYGKYTVSNSNVVVGGYHLEIIANIKDEKTLRAEVQTVDGLLAGTSYSAIPCYIDDKYVIRVGDFSTADRATSALASLDKLKSKYTVSVAEPSATAVSVVDPNINKVLFEYDGYDQLGLSTNGEGQYMTTYQSRMYGGTMCYKRANGGVQVTSLIDFEEYVPCVVPWEIGSGWHYNALTAFSIAARSYALKNKNSKFAYYGVDIYDDASDQVYGGFSKVTDRVLAACRETKGLVAFYNGQLASLYYSSSTGGYVVSNSAAWGNTALPYLATKATPWETYVDRGNGMWVFEMSPSALAASLRESSSCASLTSPISSVTINSTAGASGYVTSVTVVDTAGHTVTVGNTTSRVKNVFWDVLNSANFVVGKGSVTLDYEIVKDTSVYDDPNGTGYEGRYPNFFDKFYISSYNIKTKNDKDKNSITAGGKDDELSIITSTGRKLVSTTQANVLTSDKYLDISLHPEKYNYINIDRIYENASNMPDLPPSYNGEVSVNVNLTRMKKTYTASSSGNFVFAGKGWGHGVGMSQYGVLDLAWAGMSGPGILKSYFTGITIAYY